jgi:hypothetical protein
VDLPDERVPIGIAVSGAGSCALAGAKADLLVAIEPEPELVEMFDKAGGRGKPKVGQVAFRPPRASKRHPSPDPPPQSGSEDCKTQQASRPAAQSTT